MVSTIAMETLDPTTMRSIIHEQTSGEQFFSYFEPRKWCFPGIYYRNGDIGPNDNAEHHPRADKRRAFFFAILNPVSDVFLATTIAMEKFSRPNDDAEHRPRAAKQRCPSRVAISIDYSYGIKTQSDQLDIFGMHSFSQRKLYCSFKRNQTCS